MRRELPTFVRTRPLTHAAVRYADELHAGQERDGDHAHFMLHPLEVAALLDSFGCPDVVTAAAVLHDTLEETGATREQLEERFGARVAELVAMLTEPQLDDSVGVRKGALRDQVARADREVAEIFAADKISKLKELRIRLTLDPGFGEQPAGLEKLDHYWKSLSLLEARLGDHPLVGQLRFELEALRVFPPREASVPVS
jgi:(p)ppGpp synthase/HD superfamily hydrolase